MPFEGRHYRCGGGEGRGGEKGGIRIISSHDVDIMNRRSISNSVAVVDVVAMLQLVSLPL